MTIRSKGRGSESVCLRKDLCAGTNAGVGNSPTLCLGFGENDCGAVPALGAVTLRPSDALGRVSVRR